MKVALVLAAFLAVCAWLVPIHLLPWPTFHSDFAMICAAVLLATTATWSRRNATDHWPALAIVSLLSALIPATQYCWGHIVFLDDAWMSALYLVGFALVVVTGSMFVTEHGLRKPIESFSWLVVIAGMVCVWICLYQWLRLEYLGALVVDLAPGTRLSANLSQPNQLATLLVWGLVGTGFLYTVSRIGPVVAVALVCMLGLGLAMTQSRAGLLGSALIIVWLLATRHKAAGKLSATAVLASALILVCCVVAWQFLLPLSPDDTGRTGSGIEAGMRPLHWVAMLDAILQRPWLGYGWGQLPVAHYEVALDHPVSYEVLGFAHNQALDVVVWSGIPLGVLIVCAVIWWLFTVLRRAHTSEHVFATAAVMGVFAHAMVEFPLAHAYFLLPTGFLMGGLSFALARPAFVSVPRGMTTIVLACWALAAGLVARDYVHVEAAWAALRLERAGIGLPAVEHQPQPFVLKYLGAFLVFARAPVKAGMSQQELDSMKRVAMRNPLAGNLLRYAAALALNNEPEQASKNLARICKMSPSHVCAASQAAWAASAANQPRLAAVAWPAIVP
jgi:O-antigen ligase